MTRSVKVASATVISMTSTGPLGLAMVLFPTYEKPETCIVELVMFMADGVVGGVGCGVGVGAAAGEAVGVGSRLVLGVGLASLGVGVGVTPPVGVGDTTPVAVGVEAVGLSIGASAKALAAGPAAASPTPSTTRAAIASAIGRATAGIFRSRMARGGCYIFFARIGVQANPSAPPIVPSRSPITKPP